MSTFKWSNVPIPEGHVIPLVLGVVLHISFPLRLVEIRWLKHVLGWPLLLLGGLFAAWAVVTVGDMDIRSPTRIIDSGPYRFSRNPMYVAWTVIYVGTAVLVNTWWLLIFLPVLTAYSHYFVIRREEERLEQRFGEEYRQYCDRVGRYQFLI